MIEVAGQKEDVGALWVHLQEPNRAPSVQYRITVPSEHAKQIFDPFGSTTASDRPVPEYVRELVEEFGGFIVEGYIENIAKLMGVETKSYRWVIASVDRIREVPDGIELAGKAIRFDPTLY